MEEESVDLEVETPIIEEAPTVEEKTDPEWGPGITEIEMLYDVWKASEFEDDEHLGKTAQEKRDTFFRDVTDKEIVQMCKMDEDNPLSCMDHLMQLQGAGVIPALPSFNQVIQVYDKNIQTIRDEMCRAVRRGRVT